MISNLHATFWRRAKFSEISMGVGGLNYINRCGGGSLLRFCMCGESDTSICSSICGLMRAFNLKPNARFRCEGVVSRRCTVLCSLIWTPAHRRRFRLHHVSGRVVLQFHRCEYACVGLTTYRVMLLLEGQNILNFVYIDLTSWNKVFSKRFVNNEQRVINTLDWLVQCNIDNQQGVKGGAFI